MSHRKLTWMLTTTLLLALPDTGWTQDDPSATAPAIQLNDAEQSFVEQMTSAVMVGRFSIDAKPDLNPQPERYAIQSVTKVSETDWIVQARITYGKYDLPVPVPVKLLWAGDTPVLQVTDLKIPLMGEGFTARVMFYKNRYAGSWYHGKVGGHMWGTIEKADMPEPPPNPPAASQDDRS